MKASIFPCSKKGNLRISKTYRGLVLTAIDAQVYNDLLLKPEIEKILLKKSELLLKKSLHNITDFAKSSNHQRIIGKES